MSKIKERHIKDRYSIVQQEGVVALIDNERLDEDGKLGALVAALGLNKEISLSNKLLQDFMMLLLVKAGRTNKDFMEFRRSLSRRAKKNSNKKAD